VAAVPSKPNLTPPHPPAIPIKKLLTASLNKINDTRRMEMKRAHRREEEKT
jgi:hypothetical protein